MYTSEEIYLLPFLIFFFETILSKSLVNPLKLMRTSTIKKRKDDLKAVS